MSLMLNDILQLEFEGEGRESAMETVLMLYYTSDGILKSKPDGCR